ncbi:MAG: DUF1365 domain-containing protein [Myxococcales bacterium]|nr:DUF1365 domain-containing protein [Myxococcales bacterium]
MRSALYVGRVNHRRTTPVANAFAVPLFLAYLDLDELPEVFAGRWLWGVERRTLASFHRADHLGDPAVPLADAVRKEVEARIGRAPRGPIRLLTNLRCWGYAFNPVSFYYCFDERERLDVLVADVANTPWNEHHRYVLPREAAREEDGLLRWTNRKDFHVSPFIEMDCDYRWVVSEPGERLRVAIANERAGARFFSVALDLERRAITGPSLARTLARHPFMTGRVIAGIYAQAFRLKRKGVPWLPHPELG